MVTCSEGSRTMRSRVVGVLVAPDKDQTGRGMKRECNFYQNNLIVVNQKAVC